MTHPPLHLTARDFDAYAPEKATSNAYSRPRLEVKQRALAWARSVVARLAELGIDVDVHGSDEHPTLRNKKRVECQWVFFWRDEKARDELDRLLDRGRSISAVIDDPSPYTRHAFLALRLDAGSVEVCFAVHPEARVDLDNLHARLEPGAEHLAAELMGALSALPEQFVIGVAPADDQGLRGDVPADRVACGSITPEALRGMLERAAAGQVPLWLGWSIARETAIEHAAILDEQLADALVALAPIYKLVAWSQENALVALDRRIESAEQERARTHAEAEAQTERWRAEQAEARRREREQARAKVAPDLRRPVLGQRKPSLATLFSDGGRSAPRREPRQEPLRAPVTTGARPIADRAIEASAPQADESAASTAGGNGALRAPAPSAVVEKGARVRVLSGAFADKVGVVGELDGRGGARVLLGLLSTRLDLADLEPVVEGRERPALQSSHRRPAPPPPRKARG